jgi:hypothetical protein
MESKFYIARARIYHSQNQRELEQNDLEKARSVDSQLPKHIEFVPPDSAQQREGKNFKNPVE